MSSKPSMTSSKTTLHKTTLPNIPKTIASFIPDSKGDGLTTTIISFIRLVIIILLIVSFLFLLFAGGTITSYTIGTFTLLTLITFMIMTNQSNLGGLFNFSFIITLWVFIVSIALFLTKPIISDEDQQKRMQNLALWLVGLYFASIIIPSIFSSTGGIIDFLMKNSSTIIIALLSIFGVIATLSISFSWNFFTDKMKWISAGIIALLILLYASGKDILAYLVVNRDFMFVNLLLLALLGVANYFIYTKASQTFGIVTMILSTMFAIRWLYLYFIQYKNVEGGQTFNYMMKDLTDGSALCMSIKDFIIFFITKFAFILFALYAFFVYYIYKNNSFQFLETHQTLSVYGFLFIGLLLLSALVYSMGGVDKETYHSANEYFSFIGGLVAKILFIGVILFIAFYAAYSFSKANNAMNLSISIINALLLFVFFAIVLQYFRKGNNSIRSTQTGFFGFIYNLITYIPCLFIELIESIQTTFGDISREKTMSIIVLIELLLIGLKFLLPYLSEKVLNHSAIALTDKVLPTEIKTPIMVPTYFSDAIKPIYNYGLSSWIYIHPEPVNTNEAYLENTVLYTFGGVPTLYYNSKKNVLLFTVDTINEDGSKKTVQIKGKKDIEVLLERWNHVYVNFIDGNFDVFINGELVLTENNIIPYGLPRGITVGNNPGIYGELSSLVYYKNPLLEGEIKLLYKALSSKNPPLV